MDPSDNFAREFIRCQRRIYGFIMSLVANSEAAEDLFQQTSLTLWETRDRYDDSRDFVAWACGIARNHIRNFLREKYQKGGKLYLSEEILQQLSNITIANSEKLDSRMDALSGCIEQLNPEHRDILEQRYQHGLNVAEIARLRDTTPNAISMMLSRIRRNLFKCISSKTNTGDGNG